MIKEGQVLYLCNRMEGDSGQRHRSLSRVAVQQDLSNLSGSKRSKELGGEMERVRVEEVEEWERE